MLTGAVVFVQGKSGCRQAERAALVGELARQGVRASARDTGTARECFEGILREAAGAAWLVYLQDDMWPAPDFAARVSDHLAAGTFNVLMLYCDRRPVLDAYRPGRHGRVKLPASALTMANALAVGGGLIPSFLDFYPRWLAGHPEHAFANDLALGAYCRLNRLIIQAAVPSLAQHRDADSLLGHPCGRRRSRTYRLAYGEVPPC